MAQGKKRHQQHERHGKPKAQRYEDSWGYEDPKTGKFDPSTLVLDDFQARNDRQLAALDAIEQNDMTVLYGPAGTAKTFLASRFALEELQALRISKIVITRPAIEAGEQIGFLPGDLDAKMDPYLRPVLDNLGKQGAEQAIARMREEKLVEGWPVSFMRGNTFDRAIIILDEVQNCTIPQLKTVITRVGEGTRVILCGDPGQCDLVDPALSCIHHMSDLSRLIGAAFVEFTEEEIVRSRLAKKAVKAFAKLGF